MTFDSHEIQDQMQWKVYTTGVIIYLETLWMDNPTGSFTSAFGMYLIRHTTA